MDTSPLTDEFELSGFQREKLLSFIGQADQIIGDGDFDRFGTFQDAGLMASALRAAQMLGFQGKHLEQFFAQEFGISGVTGGDLGTLLAIVMMLDVEKRIRCAAGGKN